MGKRKQFDEAEVLMQIAEHFWKHGYTATRVDQLSSLTGLTKTSIYNAFGNKESLFLRVIEFYVERGLNLKYRQLDTDRSMSENLETLFELSFSEEHNKRLTYGCLLINSIVELEGNEPTLYKEAATRFEQVRQRLREFFSFYVNSGQVIPGVGIDELTDLFMTFIQGLRVQSRNPQSEDALKRSINGFLTLIKSVEIRQHA